MSETVPLDSEKGQAAIESLVAKMTPEQQAKFKESLAGNKPVHVHMDKDGNILLGDDADAAAPASQPPVEAAPEAPVELKKDKPKKMSKIDEKRQQIFMDRLRRKMAQPTEDGKPRTQQQALQEMAKEDYDALPLQKKFERLESIVAQSFRGMSQEVVNLGQNHAAIADAFDINYRAIQKMFLKLGMSAEEQKQFIEESQAEVLAERRKQMAEASAARMNQQREAQDAAEKQKIEAGLAEQGPKIVGAPTEDEGAPPPPPEATVFGG